MRASESRHARHDGFCYGSQSRVQLSVDEEHRRKHRCYECGRELGIRPTRPDETSIEATVPRHKPGR